MTHAQGIDQPLVWYEGSGTNDRRWLHRDERGSIVAITNGTGGVIDINAYDTFGIPASGNTGRFGYTGQIWLPEVGMWYYKARMYSPTLGRFMQTDPIGYDDNVNLYAYVGNDPINLVDPTGMECVTIDENARCTIDVFLDEQGNEVTREEATASSREARRIADLEADLTAKYSDALALQSRGGSVTVKGNRREGIPDQEVSGDQIVSNMESAVLVSSSGTKPGNPASNATTTAVFVNGVPSDIRITFWNNPTNRNWGRTFGHEALHPTAAGLLWRNLPAHDRPFDRASDRIR